MHEREFLMAVVGITGIAWSGALLAERSLARGRPEDQAHARRRWGLSPASHLAALLILIVILIGLGLELSRVQLVQLVLSFVAGMFLVQQLSARWRTRSARTALRLAAAGNMVGAVEDIRKQIALHGPSAERYNTLGVLLSWQSEWEEAARALETASDLGQRAPQLLGNLGVALGKLGRIHEAVSVLAEACRAEPENFTSACHYCLALAEAGRCEEAVEVRHHVEYLYKRQWLFSGADRAGRRWLLEECRRQTAGTRLLVG
ncbi:MAG TPA: hypothetical protein VFA18_03960 [Gemmataceae bacterium]|nr:hypothetical protein [Gemmataceae bacterium]